MIALLALATMGTATASSQIGASRDFGLGIQLGTFSGITGKYYLRGRTHALDFAIGGGYGQSFVNSFHTHVTYSVHFKPLASGGGVRIPVRVGVGGWVNSGNYWAFRNANGVLVGARAPVGLDFDLERAPVQFFVEVALNLAVIPFISAGLDAGIGARYYF